MADLERADLRLARNIGPAQRGLSDLGDHNAQPAWGSIEEVDIGDYEGHHRVGMSVAGTILLVTGQHPRRDPR